MRAFHVSPFNDRADLYDANISYDNFDILLNIQTTSASKKLMARVWALQSHALNATNLVKTLFLYSYAAFMTMPRIAYQAGLLAYRHKLQIFNRPIPLRGVQVNADNMSQSATIGWKSSSRAQMLLLDVLLTHLENLSRQKHVSFTVAFPTYGSGTTRVITSDNCTQELFLALNNFSLPQWLVLDPDKARALAVTYVRGDWDVSNLDLFLNILSSKLPCTHSQLPYISKPFLDTHFSHLFPTPSHTLNLEPLPPLNCSLFLSTWLLIVEVRYLRAVTAFVRDPSRVIERIATYGERPIEEVDDLDKDEWHRWHCFLRYFNKN